MNFAGHGQLLQRLSGALYLIGEYDQVRAHAEELHRIGVERNLQNDVGGALYVLGLIERDQGNVAQAAINFSESLVWFCKKAATLTNWGRLAMLGLASVASLRARRGCLARLRPGSGR